MRAVLALLLVLCLPATAFAALDAARLKTALDAVMQQAVAEQRIVGSVVLVAEDGALLYHNAVGYADREAGTPMREEMRFRLASMTKPIISATAMALVEDGVLELDAPVTRWLPYFTPRLADGTQPVITLRHLLTHTSGLGYAFMEEPDGAYHRAGITDGLMQQHGSAEEALRLLAAQPLWFAPGTRWQYSLATDVVGEIIAQATGKPLPQVVAEQVTTPLGMADTAFSVAEDAPLAVPYADATSQPLRMGKHHSLPFGKSSIEYAPERIFDRTAYPSGGSGMAGTAADYLAFLEALRKDGGAILSPQSTREFLRNQTGDLQNMNGPGWGWSLAASVLTDPAAADKPMAAGTMLWGGVYGTNFWMDKQNGLSVVIMTNTAVAGTLGAYPRAIRNAIYAAGVRK